LRCAVGGKAVSRGDARRLPVVGLRLAEDSADASRLRATLVQTIAGAPPRKGGIRRGVLEKPAGKRPSLIWGRLMAEGKARGRPRSALDTIIAAVAEANARVVVTGNEKDFVGVATINPFRDSDR
jgi:hypothetical protein